jgi:hypothetical protein
MVNNAVRCELWSLGRLPAPVKARPPSRELHLRWAELERVNKKYGRDSPLQQIF